MTTRTIAKYCAGLMAASALLWPATAAAEYYDTQAHNMVCAVAPDPTLAGDEVACQGQFTQAEPAGSGFPVTTGDGTFHWEQFNLNVGEPITALVDGQTYHHGNWTIYPDETGIRFVNDRTGHGMFVSIKNVYSF
ncbi:hypothetical protein [Mycobacterium sp. E2733]|uniref:hypothetical protein n=1 Tax=Mycobacterium sp. E2733 TaxID=1834138 RepID=UPI0008005968|nr:hypothetical protein [Mycobacterium sp. E2733]OBH94615.1 hypothetical protein A5678_04230 [Mycobacterium sp. E2733]